jgi:hypothetical protein
LDDEVVVNRKVDIGDGDITEFEGMIVSLNICDDEIPDVTAVNCWVNDVVGVIFINVVDGMIDLLDGVINDKFLFGNRVLIVDVKGDKEESKEVLSDGVKLIEVPISDDVNDVTADVYTDTKDDVCVTEKE